MLRFSSLNDLRRAVSLYAPETIDAALRVPDGNRTDQVKSTLDCLDQADDLLAIIGIAHSSCYSDSLVESEDEQAELSEIRATLINRTRDIILKRRALRMQLKLLATVRAQKLRLREPNTVTAAFTKFTYGSLTADWNYARLAEKLPDSDELDQLVYRYEVINLRHRNDGNTWYSDHQVLLLSSAFSGSPAAKSAHIVGTTLPAPVRVPGPFHSLKQDTIPVAVGFALGLFP